MRRQRGQALTELALIAPLFAVFLLLFAFWARLAVARVALIQLTRDSTLMLARNGTLWNQPVKAQEAAVRNLALRQDLFKPADLHLRFETVAPAGLDKIESLQSHLQGPLGSKLVSMAGLRRYHLRCRIPLAGLAGRLTGGGIDLEESLVIQGDPWKMLGSEAWRQLFQ